MLRQSQPSHCSFSVTAHAFLPFMVTVKVQKLSSLTALLVIWIFCLPLSSYLLCSSFLTCYTRSFCCLQFINTCLTSCSFRSIWAIGHSPIWGEVMTSLSPCLLLVFVPDSTPKSVYLTQIQSLHDRSDQSRHNPSLMMRWSIYMFTSDLYINGHIFDIFLSLNGFCKLEVVKISRTAASGTIFLGCSDLNAILRSTGTDICVIFSCCSLWTLHRKFLGKRKSSKGRKTATAFP